MKTRVFPDYAALCAGVADRVLEQLQAKPDSVLVFPTGNTPIGMFASLVERSQAGVVSFSKARFVMLDEYADLPEGDPRSLSGWLKRELLAPVGADPLNIHGFENGPNALERNITALGGLDLVILGLGPNGHLGFNEPGSPFDSRARRVDLAQASITSNAAYWGSEEAVPRQGYTLGLGTLAEAREIILMVNGTRKHSILKLALEGDVTPNVPASLLESLPQSHLFADRQAIGI
jgi:glucosamine-6-phosphate deaminase